MVPVQAPAVAELVEVRLLARGGEGGACLEMHDAVQQAIRARSDGRCPAERVLDAALSACCGQEGRAWDLRAVLESVVALCRGALSDRGRALALRAAEHCRLVGEVAWHRRLLRAAAEVTADEEELCSVLGVLAPAEWELGHLDAAGAAYERLCSIAQARPRLQDPAFARTLAGYAMVLGELGRHEEACVQYGRALQLSEDRYGPGHPKVGQMLNCLAICLTKLGRDQEAEAHLQRAEKILEASGGGILEDTSSDGLRGSLSEVREAEAGMPGRRPGCSLGDVGDVGEI